MRELVGKLLVQETCVGSHPSMEEAVANKKEERERNVHHSRRQRERERESFGHARGLGNEGGAPTRLEGEVGKLVCEACMKHVCMCVEVEREKPQAFH